MLLFCEKIEDEKIKRLAKASLPLRAAEFNCFVIMAKFRTNLRFPLLPRKITRDII